MKFTKLWFRNTLKEPQVISPIEKCQNQQGSSYDNKRKIDNDTDSNIPHKRWKSMDNDQQQNKEKKLQIPVKKDPKTTVFISNLENSVVEDNIRALFPNALNMEILRDRRNKLHQYGYVEFKNETEMTEALLKDRELLNGRPLYISPLKSEKTEKKPSFKYAMHEEKNKLFIKGLPVNKTQADIVKIYESYHPKNVRVVSGKNGQSKGLAYVEFENELDAQEALKHTDKMIIDDCKISVVISAPPPRKDKPIYGKSNDDEQPIRHARSRLQTSLLPRSLLIKNSEAAAATGSNSKQSTASSSTLSNSDFKEMFLKK